MSREVWQQRLLESVFVFFTDDLKNALLGQISELLHSGEKIVWLDIAETLRPFFVIPDAGGPFIGNVLSEVYALKAFNERQFDDSLQTLLSKQSESDAAFMKRIATIPSTSDEIAIYIKMARDFELLLDGMEDDEIVLAYRQLEMELDRINTIHRERDGSARDKFAFFSEFRSDARFDYWLQMAGWNSEECVALSLGKEPKIVNPQSLTLRVRPKFHSPFRQEFKSRLEIIQRAQMHGSLPDSISPKKFVTWALELRWNLPPEVQHAFAKKTATDVSSENIALSPSPGTVYRLLLGMAITRFEHRTDRNSSATALIEEELRYLQELDDTGPNTLGKILVKNDAIRKALDAAAEHLGASWSESLRWKGVRRPKSEN